MTVICPTCRKKVTPVSTSYGERHACCGLWSWGGKPLVSAEVHELRKRAHAVFDPIWKEGQMPRSEAYRQLSIETGIKRKKCHIAMMNVNDLKKTILAAKKICDINHCDVIEDYDNGSPLVSTRST